MNSGYSQIRVRLHWLTLLLVLIQFLVQQGMVDTMEALRSGQSPSVDQFLLSNLHLLCGGLVLVLTVYRLVLRIKSGPMAPAAANPRWMARLAVAVHWSFYAVLIVMPVSGALAYYQVTEIARDAHLLAKWILLFLLFVHIAAAIVHLLWRKDGVWQRMVQWRLR